MNGRWKMMSSFALTLPNKPGELAHFTAQLKDARINLLGMWCDAPASNPQPRVACVPESAAAFRQYFNSGGLNVEEGTTFYYCEKDTPGALVVTLRRIADAGINVESIECISVGEWFGCFLWPEPARVRELAELLDVQ